MGVRYASEYAPTNSGCKRLRHSAANQECDWPIALLMRSRNVFHPRGLFRRRGAKALNAQVEYLRPLARPIIPALTCGRTLGPRSDEYLQRFLFLHRGR